MAMRRTVGKLLSGGLAAAALLAPAVALVGCGPGVSDFEQRKQRLENAEADLKAKGGTIVKKSYPQGDAFAVDMSKITIDDDVLQRIRSLGRITELNLSGSTITDEQLTSLAVPETLGFLLKLDVSDTAITDTGLVATAPLPLLSDVNVKGSKVTDAGIAEFKKKHPAKNPFGLKLKFVK